MPDISNPELLAQDAALRSEADAILVQTGLGSMIAKAGYHAVGSYVMRTMVWRDLDFEREASEERYCLERMGLSGCGKLASL